MKTTSGDPVPGAVVTLVSSAGSQCARGSTAADGSFSLEATQPATYTLVASAPGYRASTKVLEVGPSGVQADFRLAGVGRVTGRAGGARGTPGLAAEIELRLAGGRPLMRYRAGPDGAFSFDDVLEGTYELVARAPAHKTEQTKIVVTQASCTHIELALVGIGHVYGAVCSAGGAWLPGTAVTLATLEGEPVATTATDGAGSYHFDEVPEGSWLVSAGSAPPTRAEVAAGSATLVDITLPAG